MGDQQGAGRVHRGRVAGQDEGGGVHLGDDRRARRSRRRRAASPGRRRGRSTDRRRRGSGGCRRARPSGRRRPARGDGGDVRARAGDGRAGVDQLVVDVEQEGEQPVVLGVEGLRRRRTRRPRSSHARRRRPGSRSPGRGSGRRPGRSDRLVRPRRRPWSASRWPASSASSRRIVTRSAPLRSANRRSTVRADSSRRLVVASPSAQSTPGDGGTMTGQAPVSLPSALACSGPAPPKATSAKSRGSKPCCTETRRRPPSMFSLTMSTMPAAAASGDSSPMASATLPTAARAGVDVEGDLAAGQRRRQVAEDDVGVGDRGLGAALAVGGGAGVGAGGLRADAQRLGQLGHVRDRAAAGADRADVDAGGADGEVADLGLAADPRGEVLDEGDVGGGAAHVEGDQVAVAALLGDPHRAGDAAGRAGQQHGDRGATAPPRTAGRRRCAGWPARPATPPSPQLVRQRLTYLFTCGCT